MTSYHHMPLQPLMRALIVAEAGGFIVLFYGVVISIAHPDFWEGLRSGLDREGFKR